MKWMYKKCLICAAFQYESCVRLANMGECLLSNIFFLLDFHCLTYSAIGEWAYCALVCSLQSRQLSKQRSSEVVLLVVLVGVVGVVGVVCGWWDEHCKIENEPTS